MTFDFRESAENGAQEIAAKLRAADIKTEIYLGKEDTFKGQLAYAVKNEYPVVVIVGDREIEKGVVQIKDMAKREQAEIPIYSVVSAVKGRLGLGE